MSSDTPVVVACWREIGIFGDRSCPELKTVGHCWHCPVYSMAAKKLLRTESTADIGHDDQDFEWSEKKEEARGTAYVIFGLGHELWAIEAKALREVHPVLDLVPIPHRTTGIVAGVAVLRGEVLLVAKLRTLLNAGPQPGELPPTSRLIVATSDSGPIGFIVDRVEGIKRQPPESLQPPPASISEMRQSLVDGMFTHGAASVAVLSKERLFAALEGGMS